MTKLLSDIDKILSSQGWLLNYIHSYGLMRKILIQSLGIADKRTINKWLGRRKQVWKRKSYGLNPSYNVKDYEYEKGILEELGFVISCLSTDKKDRQVYYLIIKDKQKTLDRKEISDMMNKPNFDYEPLFYFWC